MKTAVIGAGGSGGHMFPARALAQTMVSAGIEVVLITDRRGQRYVTDFPVSETVIVDAATLTGKSPLAIGKMIKANIAGIVAASKVIRRLEPDVVIGFGGYPSIPAVGAGWWLGVPIVLHEQNAVVGRANRLLAKICCGLALGGDRVSRVPKVGDLAFTGTGVRQEVIAAAANKYVAPSPQGELIILITGGSQGAGIWTKVIPEVVLRLRRAGGFKLKLFQQCHQDDIEKLHAKYDEAGIDAELAPFFTNMPELMAMSHIVIARAGASTMAEICAIGRPAILVPYPFARDNDQLLNARHFVNGGAGYLIEQKEASQDRILTRLQLMISNPQNLVTMAAKAKNMSTPDANQRLLSFINEVI